MVNKMWKINVEATRILWCGITKDHLEESIRNMLTERYFQNLAITIEEVTE